MAAELGPLLKAFFEAVDPPARQAAIGAIRATAPDPREVERGLRQGRSYPADAPKGWQICTHRLRRQGSALPCLRPQGL